jgi:hypothetical protein
MSKSIIPTSRPQKPAAEVRELLKRHGVTSPLAIVGIRGYYSNTFGGPGNNRGFYDDALFVVTPSRVVSFNASTDPTIFKTGMATLKPGLHWYRKGMHGLSWKWPRVPYRALRPATPGEQLPVSRDNTANPRPGVAINIHKGGNNNTYSEGCQTLPPGQYEEMIDMVYRAMDFLDLKKVPYLLVTAN